MLHLVLEEQELRSVRLISLTDAVLFEAKTMNLNKIYDIIYSNATSFHIVHYQKFVNIVCLHCMVDVVVAATQDCTTNTI